MHPALYIRRNLAPAHPARLVIDKERLAVENRVNGGATSPVRSGVGAIAIVDARGSGVQIGQQTKFKLEPATIRVRYDIGPVSRSCATVGCVLGRVRSAVNQVHYQTIFPVGETDALHPSSRGQNNIIRPGCASIVAPADDTFEVRRRIVKA